MCGRFLLIAVDTHKQMHHQLIGHSQLLNLHLPCKITILVAFKIHVLHCHTYENSADCLSRISVECRMFVEPRMLLYSQLLVNLRILVKSGLPRTIMLAFMKMLKRIRNDWSSQESLMEADRG